MQTEMISDYLVDDKNVTVIINNSDGQEVFTAPTSQLADYLESLQEKGNTPVQTE